MRNKFCAYGTGLVASGNLLGIRPVSKTRNSKKGRSEKAVTLRHPSHSRSPGGPAGEGAAWSRVDPMEGNARRVSLGRRPSASPPRPSLAEAVGRVAKMSSDAVAGETHGAKKKPTKDADADEEYHSLEKRRRKKNLGDAGLLAGNGDFPRASSSQDGRLRPGGARGHSAPGPGRARLGRQDAAAPGCDAEVPGQRWEEVGPDKPKSGALITNAGLAAALQRKVLEFSQGELDKFKVANLSFESYIKAGDRYFRPVAIGVEEEEVDWEAEQEQARLQWMSQLQLPTDGRGGKRGKPVCMHGCTDESTMRPVVVTHVCRQCENFLCKFCMAEHLVDPYSKYHELGTYDELRLSRFRNDGWNTRGMQRMGLGEDDETLGNLGRVFAIQKVHRVVNGSLIAMSPASALRAESAPARESTAASISRSGSGDCRVERVGSSSSHKSAARSSSCDSDAHPAPLAREDRTPSVKDASQSQSPTWMPDKTDFVHPPRRPISPLFRNKGRSVSPQRSPDDTMQQHTTGGSAGSKLQSSIDVITRARSQGEEDSAANFFDGIENAIMRQEKSAAMEGAGLTVDDAEERARIARKSWRKGAQATLFAKTMGSFRFSTDQLAPSTAGTTRSISPVRQDRGQVSTSAKARALSSNSLSPTRESTDKRGFSKSMSQNQWARIETDGRHKPMSEYPKTRMAHPKHDEEEEAGTEEVAVPVPACLRRAMTHSFINKDLQMHGNKSFFEYRKCVSCVPFKYLPDLLPCLCLRAQPHT